MDRFLVLQLADSAFPAGGFAHSGGLEAARAAGELVGVAGERAGDGAGAAIGRAVAQAARLLGPAVHAVAMAPARFEVVDRHLDTVVLGQVPNRASRAQGRALLGAACRSFEVPALLELEAAARSGGWPLHHAPVLARVARELGVAADEVVPLHLHLVARGLLSAGVRLGLFGPFEAQRLQRELGPRLAELAARIAAGPAVDAGGAELGAGGAELGAERAGSSGGPEPEAVQIDPVLELLSGLHDRLYSRLFQS